MGLSRAALWQVLDDTGPIVPPLIQQAYEFENYWAWRSEEKAPHGQPWHTSFHASSFPGDDPMVCGRLAVYTLYDLPAPEPLKPFLSAWFEIGTNLEHSWVRRLANYGALLSADVTGDDRFQTGFEDDEHWLTGSCDAVVLPRGWKKGHFVEVKTTSHEKVLQMLSPTPTYPRDHGKYLRQLRTYIGLGHELPYTPTVNLCDESGAIVPAGQPCPLHQKHCAFSTTTLEPPDDGTLIYSSREEPLTVAAFRVFHDPVFMRQGRERLAQWRDDFLNDRLPAHPREGLKAKWSVDPCQYCLSPHALVLTADLRWVLASFLQVGDEIVGFDEQFTDERRRSKYRRAVVEGVPRIQRPRIRILTDVGYSETSSEHRYLTMREKRRCWVEAKELVVGDEIVAVGQPWIPDRTYEAGWLAGIFDGEGYVAEGFVAFAQIDGPVLECAKELLDLMGFEYSLDPVDKSSKKICWRVRVNGGVYEQMRLLGTIRPNRLLAQSASVWEGHATWSKISRRAIVRSIELLPEGEVIALATSTQTLVADGLLSHNCALKKTVCKPDYTDKIEKLSESHMSEHAKSIRPEWDAAAKRAAVLFRWGFDEQGQPVPDRLDEDTREETFTHA